MWVDTGEKSGHSYFTPQHHCHKNIYLFIWQVMINQCLPLILLANSHLWSSACWLSAMLDIFCQKKSSTAAGQGNEARWPLGRGTAALWRACLCVLSFKLALCMQVFVFQVCRCVSFFKYASVFCVWKQRSVCIVKQQQAISAEVISLSWTLSAGKEWAQVIMRTSEEDKLKKSPQMWIEYWLHIFKRGKKSFGMHFARTGLLLHKGVFVQIENWLSSVATHKREVTRFIGDGASRRVVCVCSQFLSFCAAVCIAVCVLCACSACSVCRVCAVNRVCEKAGKVELAIWWLGLSGTAGGR